MTSKHLILILTATTVITVGTAIANALPQQSGFERPTSHAPQVEAPPKFVQPASVPLQASRDLSSNSGTYGFQATPEIPEESPLLSVELVPAEDFEIILAGLETGELSEDNSPLAESIGSDVVSEYDVAPGMDATLMGNQLVEPSLPEQSLSEPSLPDLETEFSSQASEQPNYEATEAAPIEVISTDSNDNSFTEQQTIQTEFGTIEAKVDVESEAIEVTPAPVVLGSAPGVAQFDVLKVEQELSAPAPPQVIGTGPVVSTPIQSFAAPSVIESPTLFSNATASPLPAQLPAPTYGSFPTKETWQAPLTGRHGGMSNQRVYSSSSPATQTNQWVPPATTPGYDEIVPINSNLSLSPSAQPGTAVQSYLPVQPPAFTMSEYIPNFDPQVGHRQAMPIQRSKIYPLDDGEKFDFETKKRDFPPFNEIIATGRFFYMAEVLWAEPQFQGNTAIATEATNFGESIPLDFDSDFHPRIRLGFESQYGPGIELTYFNINSNSEIASFTSDGNVTGQSNAWVIGRNVWSRVTADDLGEILSTQHSIDIDSGVVSFFKELKFPISRINGNFGFQYVSIAQRLNANVVAADGATVESLTSVSDMRAYGPKATLEYYRPIGHTPLELVTTFGGAVLFGQRDQVVTNSQTGLENRLGADEFLTILDFLVAVQYKKTVGENRSVYGRFGFMNQTWIGGGTAAFPQGDFGLRGLTFGIGYNR